MRVMLDANVVLDTLVVESTGSPRVGKPASDRLLELCDQGIHSGLVAWHTLPIVAYYHGRQNPPADTAAMMDALQIASAVAGLADVFVTRNTTDFEGCALSVMTPEAFLATYS